MVDLVVVYSPTHHLAARVGEWAGEVGLDEPWVGLGGGLGLG